MPLLLGALALAGLLILLGRFSAARIPTLKAFALWVGAIGGGLMLVLLILTGRADLALAALLLGGPVLWSYVAAPRLEGRRPSGGTMSRAEALATLGLPDGASREDVIAAHRRLIRGVHPDHGGSSLLAARINTARDTLLRG